MSEIFVITVILVGKVIIHSYDKTWNCVKCIFFLVFNLNSS